MCGELKLDFIDLPPFCIYDNTTFIVTCSPTLPEHEGSWEFKVTRQALEHPLSLREATFKVDVPLTPPPVVDEPEEEEEEPEEVIAASVNENPITVNIPPFFEPLPAKILYIEKPLPDQYQGLLPPAWVYKLPKIVDLNIEDEVEITVSSPNFITFDPILKSLVIGDLTSVRVVPGDYTVMITLDDSKIKVTYMVRIVITED